MKYTERYCIKWHDTDLCRRVTPSHVLAYMQETANHHLLSCGRSLDALRDEKGLAFLLSRIYLRFYRPLFAGDEIEVSTWVCESRGLSFCRCFSIERDGETVAQASSTWALIDLEQKKLLPVTAFPYDIEPDPALAGEFASRVRFPAISLMEKVGERAIVYSDVDYNGHMNNTHYPNMLCDFTPEIATRRVTGMALSFVREAALGQTLDVYRCVREGGGYSFRTLDADKNTCLEASLWFED